MFSDPLVRNEGTIVPKAQFDYLSVVGSLMHIANSVRFDIATAVNMLASHSSSPTVQCVNAAKRVLKYLYNTKSLGIAYLRSGDHINVPLIFEHASRPNGDSLVLI